MTTSSSARVLLIEAGRRSRHFWLRLPIGYFRSIYDSRFSRNFDTEPQPETGGRRIAWPRGIGFSNALFLPDCTPTTAEQQWNRAPEALEPAFGCWPKSVGRGQSGRNAFFLALSTG